MIDERFSEWVKPLLTDYDGPYKDPKALEAFAKVLELRAQQPKPPSDKGLSAAKVELVFLAAQIQSLTICPLEFQQQTLVLSDWVRFYNGDVDAMRRYSEKTFDPSITGENRESLLENLAALRQRLADRAESIAQLAHELATANKNV